MSFLFFVFEDFQFLQRAKPLRLPDQDEKIAATAKLEKKLAKQRAARMAAIEQSAKNDEDMKSSTSADLQPGMTSQMAKAFPKYDGDQFSTAGSYLDGMLYLSRMADSSIKTKKINTSLSDSENKKQKEAELLEAEQKKKTESAEKDANNKLANRDVVKNSAEDDMNAKLTCAISLCNWARNPANAVWNMPHYYLTLVNFVLSIMIIEPSRE